MARNPAASTDLMEKLNERGKVLQTLEQQLFQLTGIHAESHVSTAHRHKFHTGEKGWVGGDAGRRG